MKFLSPNYIYTTFNIPKETPLLFVDAHKASVGVNERLREYNIAGSVMVKNAEAFDLDLMKVLDTRPFDDVVVVGHGVRQNNGEDYWTVTHVRDGVSHPCEVFAVLVDQDLGWEELLSNKQEQWINEWMAIVFSFIAKKKTVIHLAEAPTRSRSRNSKKVKYKKSKVIIVSDKRYVRENANTVRVNASYQAHSVCGHVRNFWKEKGNPDSGRDLNRIGHDRHGEPVSGWTWIAPFTRGEGAEIMEKIRIYK